MMRCILFFILLCTSCESAVVPKPKAYLRLKYPLSSYQPLQIKEPFSFEISNQAMALHKKKNWVDVKYPKMKATLMLTYKPVKNNLKKLLQDAEQLTFKHVIKADDISSIAYENTGKKVFGKLYSITGDAASQIQFHLTDYKKHFLTGSLYFYAKPNYDSILPAVHYLKKDIKYLMETFYWK